MLPREATLTITINGKTVTSDLLPYLISLNYTDKSDDELDDFDITLEDREKLFQNKWALEDGATIEAYVTCTNWFTLGDRWMLDFGEFQCDELEFSASMSGDTVSIKGLPSAVTTSIKGEKKTRTWNNVKLETVISDIADENDLNYRLQIDDTGKNEIHNRIDQRSETDLEFLQRIVKEYGYRVVVKSDYVIVYSGQTADGTDPIVMIRKLSNITSARFKRKLDAVYSGATVSNTNTGDGTTSTSTITPTGDVPKTKKQLKVDTRCETAAQSERVAKAELREKNAERLTGSLSMMGDPRMRAGRVLQISGFGAFDGKYSIKEAKHSFSSSGYTTEVELEEALDY